MKQQSSVSDQRETALTIHSALSHVLHIVCRAALNLLSFPSSSTLQLSSLISFTFNMSKVVPSKRVIADPTPYPKRKPVAVSEEVTFRRVDPYDRYEFTLTEDQYDRLHAAASAMSTPTSTLPVYYDGFSDEYTIRGKVVKDDSKMELIPELELGDSCQLTGMLISKVIPNKDMETKKRLPGTQPVTYFKIRKVEKTTPKKPAGRSDDPTLA